MKVTVNQLRERYAQIEQRRRHFEWKSEQPGRLVRHEVWRHAYVMHPYLLGAPTDRVADRICSVFRNVVELGPNGKLQPESVQESDEFTQVFTHLLEEHNFRGAIPIDVISRARAPLLRYFDNGDPIGLTMFDGYKSPTSSILVKYGKREHLERMVRTGDFRLANAGLYNNSSHNDAIRDDETSRTFFIPTFKERIAGETHMNFQGHRIEFKDDDITLPLVFNDYYLFSLCNHIHYRMPTDFDADAALIIRDPKLFIGRIVSSFNARFPEWVTTNGNVIYYDPYRDYSKFKTPEMAKHFGYAYQKEFRIAFRPQGRANPDLEPIFLSIGSMADYTDLVFA